MSDIVTTAVKSVPPDFVWYDQDSFASLAISYYWQDDRKRIWLLSPMKHNFVIEDPYTGQDMMSSKTKDRVSPLFKVPWLRKISDGRLATGFKNNHLIAVLWIKDHILLSNQIVRTGHEFYRCIPTIGDTSYLLIPLYAKKNYISKKVSVMLYHSGSIRGTLLTKLPDVYYNLREMFGHYTNCFPIMFNAAPRYMVQFPENPACFLHLS